jgi:hypothetical protein
VRDDNDRSIERHFVNGVDQDLLDIPVNKIGWFIIDDNLLIADHTAAYFNNLFLTVGYIVSFLLNIIIFAQADHLQQFFDFFGQFPFLKKEDILPDCSFKDTTLGRNN